MVGGEVEIVHGARDVEIGIGVEALDEGRSLVAQIALDLEVGVEAEGDALAVLQVAAELAMQRRLGQIGDVGGHARDGEAAIGAFAGRQIVAVAPIGIGHDRLAADLVEGDVLRRVARGGGDRHGGEHALGIVRGRFQHLHAAHRAADGAEQLVDAEMVEQTHLGAHHVADGDHRESVAPGFAGGGIDLARPGGAHAAAEHVGADQEIAIGVEHLAWPDDGLPPARLAGDRMGAGHILVTRDRMADQDRVGSLGVELAVGLIGNGDGRQIDAAVETQRRIRPQLEAGTRQNGIGGAQSVTCGHAPALDGEKWSIARYRGPGCQRFPLSVARPRLRLT